MKRLFIFTLLCLSIYGNTQEKRLALIIGNSAYEYGGALKNPVNDAYAMNQALSETGFEVLVYYNLDEGELKRAIDDFGMKLKLYDVGLFFYAGHGIQANGKNFLVPVEVNLLSEQQVEYDCVEADRVLSHMDASGTDVNIVILDACRNNPFEQSWSRSGKGKGLAFMNAPTGTLIAYATAPGNTASDGQGNNGLYTSAILENILIPDITILQMFQNVRSEVAQRSYYEQTPWESTSLVGDFYFVSGSGEQSDNSSSSKQKRDITPIPTIEESPPDKMEIGKVSDIDGNKYQVVQIGEQKWMAENLRVTRYANGDPIPLLLEKKQWKSLERDGKAYCWDSDRPSDREVYGYYYSWPAAMNGSPSSHTNPSNVQGVCPDGWHLPSDAEWKQLEMHLGMNTSEADDRGWRGNDEGDKLKSKDPAYWEGDTSSTNSSGFTALPGGHRHQDGDFVHYGRYAAFWTATKEGKSEAQDRILGSGRSNIERYHFDMERGLSVRCVKDQ